VGGRLAERLEAVLDSLGEGLPEAVLGALESFLRLAESWRRCSWGELLAAMDRLRALAAPGRGGCGWPVVYKDNFYVAGEPLGLWVAAGLSAGARHSGLLDALIRSGAAPIARGNMHPLGMGVSGVNPVLGTVRNPLEPDLVAGGSSGGPAAAASLGAALVALGSDAAGSVRIPAAFTGLYSFVPKKFFDKGLETLQPGLERPGFMSLRPEAVVASAIIAGALDGGGPWRVRGFYVAEELGGSGGPRGFSEAVEALASELGLKVERGRLGVDPKALHYARAAYSLSLACSTYKSRLERLLPPSRIPRWELKALNAGCEVSLEAARRAFSWAEEVIEAALYHLLSRGLVLAAPAVPGPPPAVEEAERREDLATGSVLMRYTSPLSFPGVALATMPVEGLRLEGTRIPFPVQIASPSNWAVIEVVARVSVKGG
jgi:Asp-tRNA(Asn)/Glu-tRNA(Gln) amidotransferase A subunit family amidase